MAAIIYRLGSMIRETGQALERAGCRLQQVDPFLEDIFRHRSIMNLEALKPVLSQGTWVAPNAAVIGDVKLGSNASVWYGSTVRGDESPVEIGENSNVQDGCTIGGKLTESPHKMATIVGSNVTIGHGATITGCTIEDECLIGMGATIMPGAKLEKGCMVAAGAMVEKNTIVPGGELWGGIPAKHLRELKPNEAEFLPVSAQKYVELAGQHKGDVDRLVDSVRG